ncbi:P-loop NTPase family protein [Aeromonas allosaccharophila]|uniref:Uncharacterized protein n=1 Tax=Aeromonas allosaccharophila TaxID=656 RepID=A0A7T2UPF3_9GAMM|nr:hypothetical protein [Aeromonas allosaccharophila]QPR55973.1 hypothetical protein I6G90_06000 [Aeromonas allosaccharophila]
MEHLAPDAARPLALLVDDKTGPLKVINSLFGERLNHHSFSGEAALAQMVAGQNEGACFQP